MGQFVEKKAVTIIPRTFLFMLLILTGSTNAEIGQVTAKICKWKNNAKAAYSIVHDDFCAGATGILAYADTIAFNRGLPIGSGAIVSSCGSQWDKLKTYFSHGHEIVSHSWSHADATGGWNSSQEIVKSKQTVETNVPGAKVTFFVFPYDKYTSSALQDLKNAGYVGARAGPATYQDRGVTTKLTGFNPFGGIYFDVYGPNCPYSNYKSNCLKAYADDAIAKGGWALQEMHGVQDGSWESCPASAYRAHLDYIKSKIVTGDLWMGTPSDVVKYIVSVDKGGSVSVSGTTLSFPQASGIPDLYAAAVTLLITTTGNPQSVSARQGEAAVAVKKLAANSFSLNANPKQGAIILSEGNTAILVSAQPGNLTTVRAPVPSFLRITVPKGDYSFRLMNLNGRAAYRDIRGHVASAQETIAVPVQALSAGFYLLETVTAAGHSVRRVVVSR